MKYDLIQEYSTEQVIGRLSSYLQKRIKTDFWDEEYGLENSVQVVICDDFTPIANSLKNKSNLEEFEFKDVNSYEIDKEFINNLPVPQGKSGGILIISDYLDLLKQIEQKNERINLSRLTNSPINMVSTGWRILLITKEYDWNMLWDGGLIKQDTPIYIVSNDIDDTKFDTLHSEETLQIKETIGYWPADKGLGIINSFRKLIESIINDKQMSVQDKIVSSLLYVKKMTRFHCKSEDALEAADLYYQLSQFLIGKKSEDYKEQITTCIKEAKRYCHSISNNELLSPQRTKAKEIYDEVSVLAEKYNINDTDSFKQVSYLDWEHFL